MTQEEKIPRAVKEIRNTARAMILLYSRTKITGTTIPTATKAKIPSERKKLWRKTFFSSEVFPRNFRMQDFVIRAMQEAKITEITKILYAIGALSAKSQNGSTSTRLETAHRKAISKNLMNENMNENELFDTLFDFRFIDKKKGCLKSLYLLDSPSLIILQQLLLQDKTLHKFHS